MRNYVGFLQIGSHLMMTNHEVTVTKAQVAELTDTNYKATLTKTKNKLSTELTATNFWLAAALKKTQFKRAFL